ncbi:MAG: ankyrin repeat domain-containing protein, partial [Coprobacillus sp.]
MFNFFKKKEPIIEKEVIEEKPKQDKRRKTLPKELEQLIKDNNIEEIKKIYKKCQENAYDTFTQNNILSYRGLTDEMIHWFVEQGCDINYVGRWEKTPLHYQASYYENHVQLYIDLGADITALDYMEETPLHYAAEAKSFENVKALVEAGADIHAVDKLNHVTPLGAMLQRSSVIDLPRIYDIVLYLLDKGDCITDEMRKFVTRIGKDYEFHKSNMKMDTQEMEKYLHKFYQLFDVAPVESRKVHDGVSPIIPTSQRWQDIHAELWDLLVPSQGHASTVQGEVIRINGKVSHEILGNGACNWDKDYKQMLKALLIYLSEGTPLEDNLMEEVKQLIQVILKGDG